MLHAVEDGGERQLVAAEARGEDPLSGRVHIRVWDPIVLQEIRALPLIYRGHRCCVYRALVVIVFALFGAACCRMQLKLKKRAVRVCSGSTAASSFSVFFG